MVKNPSDDLVLGDERNNAKLAPTVTEEWVGLVNPPDQISPTFSESGTMFGSQFGLVGFCVAATRGRGFELAALLFSREPSFSKHRPRSNEYYVYVARGSV